MNSSDRRTHSRLVALLVALALAGCGEDVEQAPATTSNGTSSSDGGGGTGSSTSSYGSIDVNSDPDVGSFAFASFEIFATNDDCTLLTEGPCSVLLCPPTAGGGGGPSFQSAGDISVESGATTLALVPDSELNYSASGPPLWDAEGTEVVEATATGADVPGFVLDVPTPGYVHVVEPVFPSDDTPMTIATTETLALTWSGGNPSATIQASLASADFGALATCRFPAAAGTAMIEPTTLQHLKGPSGGSLIVTVFQESATTVAEWKIVLRAGSTGLVDGNALGSFSINVDYE